MAYSFEAPQKSRQRQGARAIVENPIFPVQPAIEPHMGDPASMRLNAQDLGRLHHMGRVDPGEGGAGGNIRPIATGLGARCTPLVKLRNNKSHNNFPLLQTVKTVVNLQMPFRLESYEFFVAEAVVNFEQHRRPTETGRRKSNAKTHAEEEFYLDRSVRRPDLLIIKALIFSVYKGNSKDRAVGTGAKAWRGWAHTEMTHKTGPRLW